MVFSGNKLMLFTFQTNEEMLQCASALAFFFAELHEVAKFIQNKF
jgi:hypothetical protein